MSLPMNPDPTYWHSQAGSIKLPNLMWCNGQPTAATADATKPLVSPRDGAVIAQVAAASAQDVDNAVAGAVHAFSTGPWPRMSPRERGDILIRWADLVEANRDEMALLIALEMGKPISDAWQIEVRTSINLLRWYGEISDKLLDESPRGRTDSVALVTREPLGVIGAITPWNFPLTLACFKIPAALVAGNTLVLKPASQAPLSTLRLAELGTQAGLPAGVFQVITGSGAAAGQVLARHLDIAALTFTGSTDIGKQLLHFAGDSNAKPVYLELGGKSPNIIFPDAPDLQRAIDMAAWAISFNTGQMCTAGSRLLVHRDIHDEVLAGVVARLTALRSGDPLDPSTQYGPLSGRQHRDDVLAEIRAGVQTSARLILGSTDLPTGDGFYLPPAVFDDVRPDDRLAQHEIFGPVLSVLTFTTEQEAIDIANNSPFGLGSAVWTSDIARAHRISRALDTGLVWVNCFEEGDASVPFGGRKLSGHGADKSTHGIDKFTALKTTWIQL